MTQKLLRSSSLLDLDLLVDQRELLVSSDELLAQDVALGGNSLLGRVCAVPTVCKRYVTIDTSQLHASRCNMAHIAI